MFHSYNNYRYTKSGHTTTCKSVFSQSQGRKRLLGVLNISSQQNGLHQLAALSPTFPAHDLRNQPVTHQSVVQFHPDLVIHLCVDGQLSEGQAALLGNGLYQAEAQCDYYCPVEAGYRLDCRVAAQVVSDREFPKQHQSGTL